LELLGRCRWPSIAKPGSRARGPTGGVGADMRGGTVEAEGRTRLGREIPRADAAVDGDVTARVDGKAAIRGAEHLPVALLGWLEDPVSTRRPRQGRGGRGRRRGGGRAATGDADGNYLGAQSYKLRVLPNIPAKNLWSSTMRSDDRSCRNDSRFPTVSSYIRQ